MTIPDIKVGVLACQGSFFEHVSALQDVNKLENENGKRFKLEVIEIRSPKDIQYDLKALIIPGKILFKFVPFLWHVHIGYSALNLDFRYCL